ncbi:MAG: G5 domain-containing protein [Chloroflexota bacterium]|nr:G5 domain-containing protein [Chloroflexota bacterium]
MSKWATLLLLLLLAACAPAGSRTVTLIADGGVRTLTTDTLTVRDLLTESGVRLDEDDRVTPVEPTFITDGMTVRVIRVEVHTETEQQEIPFERHTVRDASVPAGETRLLESGITGVEELTYRITVEDGEQVERRLVQRAVLNEPRAEVILIGVQTELTPVSITGTVAYMANHNAWVMQTTSSNQRRLTYTGDLDGRVFALSPDGSYLLFTRVTPPSVPSNGEEEEGTVPPGEGEATPSASPTQEAITLSPTPGREERRNIPRDDEGETTPSASPTRETAPPSPTPDEEESEPGEEETAEAEAEAPLNTLWMIETATADARPVQLEVQNVLWAGWAPECESTLTGSHCRIAYATGSPAEGSPGWKAENDLWIARPRARDGRLLGQRRIVEPSAGGAYGWWGTTYAWSPDGRNLAYARADETGLVRAYDGAQTSLAHFPPYRTYAPWVWTPTVNWSPEGEFIVTTLHSPAPTGEAPEDSPVFGVWALATNNTLTAELSSEAGMWAAPVYAPAGDSIAFGRARSPYASQSSGYDLYLMDRDGSNQRPLFPPAEEIGLEYPEMVWGPEGDRLIVVYQGYLYLIYFADGEVRQLANEGNVTQVQWQW